MACPGMFNGGGRCYNYLIIHFNELWWYNTEDTNKGIYRTLGGDITPNLHHCIGHRL